MVFVQKALMERCDEEEAVMEFFLCLPGVGVGCCWEWIVFPGLLAGVRGLLFGLTSFA